MRKAKQPAKPKKYTIEGKDFNCPGCGGKNFSRIKDYGLAPEKYAKNGNKYMFQVDCLDCHCEITYYCYVGPKNKT